MEEEIISIFVHPDEYAHHIGQVASVGVETLRVVRKQPSFSTPYVIEMIPARNCSRVEYKSGLAPVRIAAGIFLLALLGGIAYYLAVYWSSLQPGTEIRVGLLGLAVGYGVRWAFMSRRHQFTFYLHDGSRIRWRSRSGDYKYKQRAVGNVLEHFRRRGLLRVEAV